MRDTDTRTDPINGAGPAVPARLGLPPSLRAFGGLLLGTLLLLPRPSDAQTVAGRVVDPAGGRPVAEASVAVMDEEGRVKARAVSDSLGRFGIAVEAGTRFFVEVSRLGYMTTRSPLLEHGGGPARELLIELSPEPVALAGLEVSVEAEAEQYLRSFGHTPESLGLRWISHDEIMDMPLAGGPFMVIARRGIPGISMGWVALEQPQPGLCVLMRGRSRPGACAAIFLNGVPTTMDQAQAMTPSDLAAIALLLPTDATTFYGTRGRDGVVLMWTR